MGVMLAFRKPFGGRRFAEWRARRRRGHAVIFGGTDLAGAIASQQREVRPVTCVGRRAVDGCLWLPAPDDPAEAAAAAASEAAELIFVDLDSDIATLALLGALQRRLEGTARRPRIVAHIRDAALRRATIDRLEASGNASIALFGLGAAIAGHCVRGERLFDRAYWRNQSRVHALIIGFTPIGRACMEEVIFAGVAGQLDLPRVTLLVPNPQDVKEILAREMPEIDQSAEIAIEPFHLASFSNASSGPLIAADNAAPITTIFICLDSENDAIAAMSAIAALQKRTGRALGPVHLLAEHDMSAAQLVRPLDRPKDDARRFVITSGVPNDPDLLDLMTSRGDIAAERLHEAYRSKFETGAASSVEWHRLPETYRAANRRTAQHLPQKLWTAGLTWFGPTPDAAAVQPRAYETIVRPTSESASEDALLRRLARLEHDRWNADRRVDGWVYGPTRDDVRKLHHNLVPFDDPRFTDLDIAKDIQQIRFLFSEVVKPDPNGATVPVQVGVISGGDHGGVGVDAVLTLLATEDWRPVVIVCGLTDEAQCRIVRELVDALDRAGRASQLVVPEIRPDNRGLRMVDRSAGLAALIGRPQTRIIPVGVPEQPGDEWADPEAPASDQDVLNRYTIKRATAIIDAAPSAA